MMTGVEGLLGYQVIEPLLGLFPARLILQEMTLEEKLSYTLLLHEFPFWLIITRLWVII